MAKKWTKKQLAALRRIVNRECLQIIRKKSMEIAGIHPTSKTSDDIERFSVSDGRVVVLFNGDDKPDGHSIGKPIQMLGKFVDEYNRDNDSVLVSSPLPLNEWKELAKEWKKNGCSESDFPRVKISAFKSETPYACGTEIIGWFHAQYILDAIEAMGTGALVYIGYDRAHHGNYPCLTVYPKDFAAYGDTSRSAFLLPCRPKE